MKNLTNRNCRQPCSWKVLPSVLYVFLFSILLTADNAHGNFRSTTRTHHDTAAPYHVLGVPRGASEDDIKTAYRIKVCRLFFSFKQKITPLFGLNIGSSYCLFLLYYYRQENGIPTRIQGIVTRQRTNFARSLKHSRPYLITEQRGSTISVPHKQEGIKN
jgi:hypothetical protein